MHPSNLGILSLDTFNYVLFRFHIAKRPHLIENVLDYMERETSIQPEIKSYGFLIKTYLKLKSWASIPPAVERMRERNLEIPDDLENILLHSYSKLGNVEKTEAHLNELKKSSSYPVTEYSFHALIEGYLVTQQYLRVYEVLGEMKAAGIEPNVRTYTQILADFGKKGMVPEMLEILERMNEENITLNHVSYSAIINAYVKNGQLPEALNWLNTMKANNVAPNMSPYATLIYGFAKSRQYTMIERMVEQSKQDGLTMSTGLQKFVDRTLAEAGASFETIIQRAGGQ
jgi:pentatricopeptide repeat protein